MRVAPKARLVLIGILSFSLVATPPTLAESSSPGSDVPETATYQPPPPPPPPPPQQDRKDNSKAAMALAAVGAAMAFASCAMLMKAAQEAQDPSTRSMMMAQALQQCGQGAQNLANAAQNKKGKDKVTSADTPKQGEIKTASAPKAETPNKQASPTLPTSNSSSTPSEAPKFEMPQKAAETDSGVVEPTAFDGTTVASNDEFNITAPADSVTVLEPIPDAKINYDDKAKQGGQTPNTNPTGSGTFVAGATSFSSLSTKMTEDLKKLTNPYAISDGTSAAGRTKRLASTSESSHGEGADGGKGKTDNGAAGGDAFGDMLSQILGNGGLGGAGGIGGAAGGTVEVLNGLRANPADEKDLPNIFQYAAFCFRKAAFEEQRIHASLPARKSLARSSSSSSKRLSPVSAVIASKP